MTFYHLNRHRTRIDGNAICALHLRYRFAIPSLLLRDRAYMEWEGNGTYKGVTWEEEGRWSVAIRLK